MPCTGYWRGRIRLCGVRSAGGVPAFGKRNNRPGGAIVVGRLRRLIEVGLIGEMGEKVVLRDGLDRHSDGLQQSVEFNFAHRTLPTLESARSQKSFVSRLNKQIKLYRSGDQNAFGY